MPGTANPISLATISMYPIRYLGIQKEPSKSFPFGLSRMMQVLVFLVTTVLTLAHMDSPSFWPGPWSRQSDPRNAVLCQALLSKPWSHCRLGRVCDQHSGRLAESLANTVKLKLYKILQEWPKGPCWCLICAESNSHRREFWAPLHLLLAVPPKHSFTSNLPWPSVPNYLWIYFGLRTLGLDFNQFHK